MPTVNYDDLLTLKEAAAYLRVSRRTIYRYIKEEQVTAHKMGGIWRIFLDDLHLWMLRLEREGPWRRSMKSEKRTQVLGCVQPLEHLVDVYQRLLGLSPDAAHIRATQHFAEMQHAIGQYWAGQPARNPCGKNGK